MVGHLTFKRRKAEGNQNSETVATTDLTLAWEWEHSNIHSGGIVQALARANSVTRLV